MAKELYERIKERFQLVGYAYHMTHIDNLDRILEAGELKSYNRMKGIDYIDLSNESVQEGRAVIRIPETKRSLHDYVPLYLGFKTPMVAVHKSNNENLIFMRFSLNILSELGAVISDGNARSNRTLFKIFNTIEDLSFLDVRSINNVKYARDPEIKRKKQAEVLILDSLPISYLLDVICYSETARRRIFTLFERHARKVKILVNPGWFFTTS